MILGICSLRNQQKMLKPLDDIYSDSSPVQVIFKQGETDMGDKGKKDKGRREQQKKAQLNLKEKRRLKKEKKNK